MPEELILDRLTANLDRLRLPRTKAVLPEVLESAQKQSLSYLQMLDALLEEEVACKEQRRVDAALKLSGLPFIKTLDDFDYTTMADLIEKLKADHLQGKSGRTRCHLRASLVVVDEVGYTPIGREECHLFYRFVAARYEKASTVITSNKAFGDWAELFHDPVIVTAILDRLLHHSVVVNIRGHSYRLKGKLGEKSKPEASRAEASRDASGTSAASPTFEETA
jgi:DNA replication protein DnaC